MSSSVRYDQSVITTQELHWYRRAVIPESNIRNLPLPGSLGSSRVAGRSGDVVVYQVRSTNKAIESHQKTIETLGLNGVFSASLKMSNPAIWGMIDTVRDYVAVLILDGVFYKQDNSNRSQSRVADYERLKFGSETQPGGLIRGKSGEYFAFESDGKSLLMNWSSSADFESTHHFFETNFEELRPSSKPFSSSVGIVTSSKSDSRRTVEVVDGSAAELLERLASRDLASVAFARLAYDTVSLTWRRPFKRFSDRPTRFGEVGLLGNGQDIDLTKARAFAVETGPADLLRDGGAVVSFRGENGQQRTIPL